MKEIRLGRVLVGNRHKRGITQDELAAYLGVSKAAVSKWETGMTYPDITLLPQLAAYFNISIDELMGYEPQMDKMEIRKCYYLLAEEFSSLSFKEALEHCHEKIKKYYSCYPLLFHMGILLVNHFMLAGSPEKSEQILEEARELFSRVKTEAEDPNLGKEALQMEAYCLLILKRPEEILELLGEDAIITNPAEPVLASAYQLLGNASEAERILQIGIYKEVVALCNVLSSYMNLCTGGAEEFEEICSRFLAVAQAFQLEKLHPGIMLPGYLMIAQGWAVRKEWEKTFEFLEKYTELATGDIYPLQLHGDSFFHKLDSWLEESLPLGVQPPRNVSVIRRSMTQALTDSPAFRKISEEFRFGKLVSRLKKNEEEQ